MCLIQFEKPEEGESRARSGMGANNSMSNKLQHNGSIDEQQLSEAEIKLIVSIWELIPDKEIFGKDIMIR